MKKLLAVIVGLCVIGGFTCELYAQEPPQDGTRQEKFMELREMMKIFRHEEEPLREQMRIEMEKVKDLKEKMKEMHQKHLKLIETKRAELGLVATDEGNDPVGGPEASVAPIQK